MNLPQPEDLDEAGECSSSVSRIGFYYFYYKLSLLILYQQKPKKKKSRKGKEKEDENTLEVLFSAEEYYDQNPFPSTLTPP